MRPQKLLLTMRIWDVPVECLCRNHLLGEHRELHAIWQIILRGRTGYARHPEVLRWRGNLLSLWTRHEEEVVEMTRRGYVHRSPLDTKEIPEGHRCGGLVPLIDPIPEQVLMLRGKNCGCRLNEWAARNRGI